MKSPSREPNKAYFIVLILHASLLVCFAFNFSCVMTFILCIRVNVKFKLMAVFVLLGLCSIRFTAILTGLKSIVRFSGDFVISGFHDCGVKNKK